MTWWTKPTKQNNSQSQSTRRQNRNFTTQHIRTQCVATDDVIFQGAAIRFHCVFGQTADGGRENKTDSLTHTSGVHISGGRSHRCGRGGTECSRSGPAARSPSDPPPCQHSVSSEVQRSLVFTHQQLWRASHTHTHRHAQTYVNACTMKPFMK